MQGPKKRINKREYEHLGGSSNPTLFTKRMGGIGLAYFQLI